MTNLPDWLPADHVYRLVWISLFIMGLLCAGVFIDVLGLCRFSVDRSRIIAHMRQHMQRANCWKLTDLVVLFLVFNVGQAMVYSVGHMSFTSRMDPLLATLILNTLFFQCFMLVAIAVLLRRKQRRMYQVFGFTRHHWLRALRYGGIMILGLFPILVSGTVIYHILLKFWGCSDSIQELLLQMTDGQSPARLLFYLLMAAVAAPVVEECLFRGILLPYLATRTGIPVAILLVSLVFAGIHAHIPSLAPIFILSLGLCTAYMTTGNLLVSITMHSLFNTYSFVVMLLLRQH